MNASGLTNEMIRNNAIYEAMPGYLQPGETKEGIVKKFNGDLVEAIKFLRKRAFAEFDKKSEFPKEHILNPVHDPIYTTDKSNSSPVKRKKKSAGQSSQKNLF